MEGLADNVSGSSSVPGLYIRVITDTPSESISAQIKRADPLTTLTIEDQRWPSHCHVESGQK